MFGETAFSLCHHQRGTIFPWGRRLQPVNLEVGEHGGPPHLRGGRGELRAQEGVEGAVGEGAAQAHQEARG
jgi:hypothetical protein